MKGEVVEWLAEAGLTLRKLLGENAEEVGLNPGAGAREVSLIFLATKEDGG